MAKPTESTTQWSSDTNFSSPSDAWDATPTKAEPSSGQKLQGWEPTQKPAAQHLNWLLSTLYKYVAWLATQFDSSDEHTYPAAKTRNVTVSLNGFTASAEGWLFDTTNGYWQLQSGFSVFVVPLQGIVPQGATITQISAVVKPGDTYSAGNRMSLDFFARSINWTGTIGWTGALSSPAVVKDDGTTAVQKIQLTGLSTVVDREGGADGSVYYVVLGGGSLSAAPDVAYGVQITYTDPGLKNF